MTVTKGRRDTEKVNNYWFTAICASLSNGVGMLALLRMHHNAFFYEEPVWSTAHEDATAVLLPAQLLRYFMEKPNASSMSSRIISGAQYRKREAKQEQEVQKSEKSLGSFLTKRPVEQSKTSSKIQMLVNLELVDPEERSVYLTNLNRISSEATQMTLQCLHAHIRWESTHIGWRRTCSIDFIFSYKIIVRVVFSGVGRQVRHLPRVPFCNCNV